MAYPRKTSPEAIRETAVRLLTESGIEALTLRKVAGALGIVPNALYRHFANRDALVAAVGDDVARALLERMRTATLAAATPEARIRALSRIYIDYANEQPALHAMIMTSTADGELSLPRPLGKDLLWRFVVDEMAGLTGPDEAPRAAVALWAVLQGIVMLKQARMLGGRRAGDVGEFPLDIVLRGLPRRA